MDVDQDRPVAGVEIRVLDVDGEQVGAALTDQLGTFELELPRGGTYLVEASRIGYRTVEGEIDLPTGTGYIELEIRMSAGVIPLDPIVVVATADADWGSIRRFRERSDWVRQYGGGRVYLGEEIRSLGFGSVQQVLDDRSWGRCRPTVFLNGLRTDGDFFGVTVEQILGIELYRQGESIPPEYYRPGTCAVALIWTLNDSAGRQWSWKRLGAAAAIVGIVWGFLMP